MAAAFVAALVIPDGEQLEKIPRITGDSEEV